MNIAIKKIKYFSEIGISYHIFGVLLYFLFFGINPFEITNNSTQHISQIIIDDIRGKIFYPLGDNIFTSLNYTSIGLIVNVIFFSISLYYKYSQHLQWEDLIPIIGALFFSLLCCTFPLIF